MRIAISLLCFASSLCADCTSAECSCCEATCEDQGQDEKHPIWDFFIKDQAQTPSKKKTPVRDFFFKKHQVERDECLEDEETCDCDDYKESCCCDCDCCN